MTKHIMSLLYDKLCDIHYEDMTIANIIDSLMAISFVDQKHEMLNP